jgi:hypothetical protein
MPRAARARCGRLPPLAPHHGRGAGSPTQRCTLLLGAAGACRCSCNAVMQPAAARLLRDAPRILLPAV